jgi:hypothetical protein
MIKGDEMKTNRFLPLFMLLVVALTGTAQPLTSRTPALPEAKSQPGRQANQSAEDFQRLKQKVLLIPVGSIVEVKLKQKDRGKFTGRLGSVTDENFEVQIVISGKISNENLRFVDVDSVKERKKMSLSTKILIGLGIWVLLGIIVGAATGFSN